MKKALKFALLAAVTVCFSFVTLNPKGLIATSKGLSTVEYIIILCAVTPGQVEISCNVSMYENETANTGTVQVVSKATGAVVYSADVPDVGGTHKLRVNTSGWAAGTYTCIARVNDNITDTKTFDVQGVN